MKHTSSAQSWEDGFGFYKSAYKRRCVYTLKTLVCFSPMQSIILLRKSRLAFTKRNILNFLPVSQASSRFNSILISFSFISVALGVESRVLYREAPAPPWQHSLTSYSITDNILEFLLPVLPLPISLTFLENLRWSSYFLLPGHFPRTKH